MHQNSYSCIRHSGWKKNFMMSLALSDAAESRAVGVGVEWNEEKTVNSKE